MDMICYTCGDRGYTHALVVCNECEGFAVHRYCMDMLDFTEDITWSCAYCEVSTNLVEQCASFLRGGEEHGTSTTTSLGSDSQNRSRQKLKENPGVKVNRERSKEKTHYLDKNEKHATVVKRESLLKSDSNKADCNKKLNIAGKKASAGEAACGKIQGNNVQTDSIVPIDQHAPLEKPEFPSCCDERECMGIDGSSSEMQSGQPKQNTSHVRAEPAENATISVKSEVRSMSRHSQTQETDHQCTVLGRSTEHEGPVNKPSAVQNSPDLISCKKIQSTTLEFLHIDKTDRSTSTGDPQLNRNNSDSAVAADVVAEYGRSKFNKSEKIATSGDAQIDGMIQKSSLQQPILPATVKSVHILPNPRIYRANGSTPSLPLHMVQRNTEQEARERRSHRIDTLPDTVDKVRRDSSSRQRRWDVVPKGLDSIPELHERSNDVPRNNFKDLFHRQGYEPKIQNFGYIPAQSLFDFVWQGWFKIDGKYSIPLVGHTSTTSRVKDKDLSELLPHTEAISLDKTSWPQKLDMMALTGHHADLFFFPLDSRAEQMVDGIIQDMINRNIVLKVKIDITELYILSSFIFPEPSRRFQGRHYLWGMFSAAL